MYSASLFDQAFDALGPAGLTETLRSIRLADHMAEPPEGYEDLTAYEALPYLWDTLLARPEQKQPAGEWSVWNYIAGRGTGKTRCGAETTIEVAQAAVRMVRAGTLPREEAKLHLVGATAADVRDVMIRGPAGILRCSPPWFPARYEPSNRRIVWPYGVEALLFAATEPDRLRGPQGIFAWADEFAAWQYPEETWDNLQFGLRLGPNPRTLITTTPRPIKILKDILKDHGSVKSAGHTKDNVRNLSPKAVARLYAKYGGTRIGRQELGGEILDDNPNALWKQGEIDQHRLRLPQSLIISGWSKHADEGWANDGADPEGKPNFDRLLRALESRMKRARAVLEAHHITLQRIVIGVDPAVSNNPNSDEIGIIVSGCGRCSCRGAEEVHGFTLDDLSGVYSPGQWGKLLVLLYNVWRANKIVAEINQGGNLVEANLRATEGGGGLPYDGVHAKQGKLIRAEPVSTLHEQGKMHHVSAHPKLETELTTWDPQDASAKSPNRLDAKVYAETELMIGPVRTVFRGNPVQGAGRRI